MTELIKIEKQRKSSTLLCARGHWKSVFKAADVKQLDTLLSMDDFKSKLLFNGIPFSLDCHHWLLYYVFNYYIFIEKYMCYRIIVKKNWNYESLRKCSCYPMCHLIFSLCTEAIIVEFLFYAKAQPFYFASKMHNFCFRRKGYTWPL